MANPKIYVPLNRFFYLLLLSWSCTQLRAQALQENQSIAGKGPEKIYLQIPTTMVANDQTLWFKALVSYAESHWPTTQSGILYVDLVNPYGKVVSHKIVKLEHGVGQGGFELDKDHFPGRYQLRAYTQWNRNFGDDFLFTEYVQIVSLGRNDHLAIEQGRWEENPEGGYTLKLTLNPSQLDKYKQKKKLWLYFDNGQTRDSVALKNKGEPIAWERHFEQRPDWLTLTLDSGMGQKFSKTLYASTPAPDLQFFPESGSLVTGIMTKIGFKSVGIDGKGATVTGVIYDRDGNQVIDFKSNELGMGYFSFVPEFDKGYYAKVELESGINSLEYALPQVAQHGYVMNIFKLGDHIRAMVNTKNVPDKNLSIYVSGRGRNLYTLDGHIKKGRFHAQIPYSELPEGILIFTLKDQNGQAVAERLFFNTIPGEDLVNIDTDNYQLRKRKKSTLSLALNSKDRQLPVESSVLIMNKSERIPPAHIRSFMLLQSELKGTIETPNFYFQENSIRKNDLDALLLTQGWRNYKYPAKRVGNSYFWPQKNLAVKGKVLSKGLRKNPLAGAQLTLAALGNPFLFENQTLDSLGQFQFNLAETYGIAQKLWLQTKHPKTKGQGYKIVLDSFQPPKVVYEHSPIPAERIQTKTLAIKQAQTDRARVEMVFDSLFGVTQLDEVILEDFHLTPEKKAFYKKYGEPDVIIEGEAIKAKEKDWSYGLYSILLFNYGHIVKIEQFPDGFMLAHVHGAGPTLIMVDGRLIEKYEYEWLPHMDPDIVEKIEIIRPAKFFRSRFLEVFPETHPLEAPSIGNIIAVETKNKVGVYANYRPTPGTTTALVPSFSPIKEFYEPKFAEMKTNQPDLRTILQWIPQVEWDASGHAQIPFYSSDQAGKYTIVVESYTPNGQVEYLEKEIEVLDEVSPNPNY
ncbi:hypothetical protein [Sediminicola luteus]|uniref:Uncharacterized protein n=1 Tax=Sediminicola luteus TaxID=319238 RepID=A0A2A4G5Q8_9FLAO|nr:hypothetical protein [Sediminicola luteus]PCE63763.1 hypothetical protein B7P33_10840 [Sediminicola luteus]